MILVIKMLQVDLAELKLALHLLGALDHLIGQVGQVTAIEESTDVLQLQEVQ